jgi:hypothetical protein
MIRSWFSVEANISKSHKKEWTVGGCLFPGNKRMYKKETEGRT